MSQSVLSCIPFRLYVRVCQQCSVEALEDAGIPLHEIYRTRTGVFCAAYTPFLQANEAPDECYLRGSAMSSIADQVGR